MSQTGARTETDGGLPGPETIEVNSPEIAALTENKNQLVDRVQTLRKELAEWRGKLDAKMKGYRGELGDMRQKLNSEVETLREQFKDLKQSLKDQLAESQELAGQEQQIAAEWMPKQK